MNIDPIRTRLQEERRDLEELRKERNHGAEDGADHLARSELSSEDQHPADHGTETFERSKDLTILQQVEARIEDVERALARIEDGTYGTCEGCGKPIDSDRLEARPAARYCLEDQMRMERESPGGAPAVPAYAPSWRGGTDGSM